MPNTRSSYVIVAFAVATLAIGAMPRSSDASTISCNIPQPCALYANAQGLGLSATSAKSAGLEGITTFAATASSNGTYGVEGVDSSTNKNHYNTGVYGYSPYGWGLRGVSPSGVGLYGASTSGTGINATSSSGAAINASTTSGTGIVGASSTANGILGKTSGTSGVHAGVTGTDAATNSGINIGVLGTTTNGGYGVEATAGDNSLGAMFAQSTNSTAIRAASSSGYGIFATSGSSIGLYASGGVGLYGYGTTYGARAVSGSGAGVTGSSSSGVGVGGYSSSGPGVSASSSSGDGIDASTSGGIGAYVSNSNGNGADVRGSYIGIVSRSDSYPMLLTNAAGNNLFYVDGSGNVYTHGSYGTFVATRNGSSSTAFTPKSTTPSVEDVGSGRLVNGSATVAFDAAFGSSIDAHAVYHVFLTPNGDTRGLYVATKTPGGFVVRETQGGRGTLDFDYRVVAATPGHARERMALVDRSTATAPKAPIVTRTMLAAPAIVAPQATRGRAIR